MFLSIIFLNSLIVCSSLNVRDQVSHPHKTKNKVIGLYILIIMLLDKWKVEGFWAKWQQVFHARRFIVVQNFEVLIIGC